MINRFERIRKEGYSFINLNLLLIGQKDRKLAGQKHPNKMEFSKSRVYE